MADLLQRQRLSCGRRAKPRPLRGSLPAVTERATQTLAWVTPDNVLLEIALDNLTLGQAALYAALLGPPDSRFTQLDQARRHRDDAVASLRKAGTTHELPRGLISRAWLHHTGGDPAAARADLDEAQAIAERGPMPLFLADIQLTRARLFQDHAALTEAATPSWPTRKSRPNLAHLRPTVASRGRGPDVHGRHS